MNIFVVKIVDGRRGAMSLVIDELMYRDDRDCWRCQTESVSCWTWHLYCWVHT